MEFLKRKKVRDTFKDKAYFNRYIKRRNEAIKIWGAKYKEGAIAKERTSASKKIEIESYLFLLKAKYSRGDNMFKKEVLDMYHNITVLMQEYWHKYHSNTIKFPEGNETIYLNQYSTWGYLYILDILSLGILLNVPNKDFNIVVDFVDKDEVKDFLIEFLIKHRIPERTPIKKESYERFYDINDKYGVLKTIIKIEDKTKAQKELKKFLEKKWYSSLKDTGYYNQHISKFDVYSGYWCFVTAAIVKIKGLDDSNFKDNPYYPKDLV
ncbi:PoNe immunity protein domain-containing protein [Gaetbulibacter jejuensis]|uniref:PoNe immunity protein domain-containing protein n=1 Tax=Gaetbulibacter jejuensis TaxID=584607 RepID=UPI00300B25FC